MIGPTAPDRANTKPKATGINLPTIEYPATKLLPYSAIARVINALPIGVAIFVNIAGKAIVRILGEETEEAVVFEAAKCLANITCDNLMGQQEVSKSGGIQAMVFLLGKKTLPNTTVQATLGALGNVALNLSMGKPTVVASAGLMPMIRFLSKRKTHPDVVAQAAKALGNTAFGSQSVKARIMAEKAGPPLVARLIAAAAAAMLAWLLVLPEYLLNVAAIRWGVGIYQPSEMAAMNLSSGIVFIALVSHFVLGEELSAQKYIGFGLMIIAMILISGSRSIKAKNEKDL
jgi:uncharacterized protein (DUF486 family)